MNDISRLKELLEIVSRTNYNRKAMQEQMRELLMILARIEASKHV